VFLNKPLETEEYNLSWRIINLSLGKKLSSVFQRLFFFYGMIAEIHSGIFFINMKLPTDKKSHSKGYK